MRIKLTDINDNEPKYKADSMPQILQVIEENDVAVIGQILPALDLDLYPNNVSCYYLYGKPSSHLKLFFILISYCSEKKSKTGC